MRARESISYLQVALLCSISTRSSSIISLHQASRTPLCSSLLRNLFSSRPDRSSILRLPLPTLLPQVSLIKTLTTCSMPRQYNNQARSRSSKEVV